MNTKEFIGVQRIYEEIYSYYGWDTDADIDIASKESLLKKKYLFLMRKVVMRDKAEFKFQGKNMVPPSDAPVIRELLKKAVSEDEDDEMIAKWFNNRKFISDSEATVVLFYQLKAIILGLHYTGEINKVTATEWISAISASINYNTAENTRRIIEEIEKFRDNSLALNYEIGIGDIIVKGEDNQRFYYRRGEGKSFDVKNTPLGELLKNGLSQNDYLDILAQVLQLLEEAAKKNAIARINTIASLKKTFNQERADVWEEKNTLASEYVIWYQRVYEFLRENPDVLSQIESETQTENLLEYFRMQDR